MIPYSAGVGATSPLNALFVTEVLGGNVTAVGTLAAITSLAAVPASGIWGALTDRMGRRGPFVVIGLLGFGLPVLLTGFSQTLFVAYALNFIMGFVSLAISPASSALITEVNPRQKWGEAFASFNWIAGLGATLGLVVGAIWMARLPALVGPENAMRSLMITCGAAGILAAGVAWIWLPPEKRPARLDAPDQLAATSHRLSLGDQIAAWLADPWLRYLVAYFLGRLSTTLALTPFAVFMKSQLGASDSVIFAAYLTNQIFPTLFYGPMGKFVRRTGATRMMMLASAGRAVGLLFGTLAVAVGAGPLGISFAVILYGPMIGISWAGMAVAGPMMVMDMVPPERAGRSMGLYNAVASVAAIAGAYLSGIGALAIGYGNVFTISTMIGVVGALAFIPLLRHGASPGASPTVAPEV